MNKGRTWYFQTLCVACLLVLTACPAKVPPPSKQIDREPDSLVASPLGNIAPDQAFATFTPHFADLDGDGHIDLLVGSKQAGTGFRVQWGDGKGHWRMQAGPASNIQPRSIAVADVDKDGTKEVLIGGEGEQHGLQIWRLDGQDGWVLQSSPTGEGVFHGVALQDVNADGWPDVVAAGLGEETPGGVHVWLNNHKGGWLEGFGPTDQGQYTDLALADLNADGYMDIIASARGGFGSLRIRSNRFQQVGGVQVWLNDGSGHWDSRLLPVEGDAESVSVADVNGDKRPDVVAGLFRSGIRVWLNEGDDWDERSVSDRGTWGSIRVADVDGDGGKDILAASRDGEGVAMWRWGNGGFFSLSDAERVGGMLPEHGVYFGIDVADVFADGHVQVAAARADGRVEVWSKRRPEAAVTEQEIQQPESQRVDLFNVTENKVFRTVDGVIEYRIGAGDEVSITLWQGGKATEYKLLVKADGTVSLPYFEAAKIEGMTAPEADAYMTRALARYLRHPRIDVRVLTMKSKRVRVFGMGSGAQTNPTGGTFYLRGRETLVDLLSRIGSPAKDADFSRIRLVRGGKTTVLDVQRAIRQSDDAENAVLDDGDTVVIPTLDESARQVYVLGEVKRPGVLSFNGEYRFLDAVSKSGGFTADAYYPDIRIVRADREVPEIYAIAFDRLLKEGDLSQNMLLQDKDIIIIPADPITNWNRFVRKLLPTVSNITSTITQVNTLRSLLRNTANSNVFINTGGGF